MKLIEDAKGLHEALIKPLEAMKLRSLSYIVGNHEDWLNDLQDTIPALEGYFDVKSVLHLSPKWNVVPQGEFMKLGKLVFMHGDTIKGGEYSAKWGALTYGANVRFGHYHTYQVYTRTAAVESNGHTGVAVPCLCHKFPRYGGGAPNRWMQGFLYGAINGPAGAFGDAVAVIVNGQAVINGKVYRA